MVFQHHTRVVEDRKHLQQGTIERSYYTAGYLQALKDFRDLIGDGEFPNRLSTDGGPRVAMGSRTEHEKPHVSEL
jgi:hypothetical protein